MIRSGEAHAKRVYVPSQIFAEGKFHWRRRFALHLLDSEDTQKSLQRQIHCEFIQTLINYTHQTAYTDKASSLEVLWHSLLKILKNLKELLEHHKSPNLNQKKHEVLWFFDPYNTTFPHQKLKSRLATIIWNSFIHKTMEIGDTNIWF